MAPESTTPALLAPAEETGGPPPGGDDGEPATQAPPTADGWARLTTRRWLQVGVGVALAVLTILGLIGVWALKHESTVTDELVDRESTALIASIRLEAAMLDQETGIRGYGIAARSDFLTPYNEGRTREAAALRVLQRQSVRPQERADLAEVTRRARTWQSRVAEPVAATSGVAATRLADERAAEGKTEFDALRAAMAAQQRHLSEARAKGRADLRKVQAERDIVLLVSAGVIVALAVLVFAGLRRGVTGPLERLAADTGAVADGDFDHPITGHGPADLRRVATGVEAMRQRLTEELVFSGEARDRLAEQAADLRRSNAELEQFAYVASHDLQEPLRKVASFSQMLRRRYAEQLDERANQYIDFAIDGANRMQSLINDLLQFSRVGRMHEKRVGVDLEEVYDTTVGMLSIAVEESGAEITHDPLPTVTGDPSQLTLLLQNLLSNAIKFRSPDRSPRIHVSAEAGDDGLWHLAVADNGIGIGPEYTEKIFVIFQRLHTREAYPGTGIGLAMCKKIVEFHGGTIGVDTAHEPGTRFVFTLPAPADEPGEPDDAGES
jgi:signal transduction histidine kinase